MLINTDAEFELLKNKYDPENKFKDCSSFYLFIYRQFGIEVIDRRDTRDAEYTGVDAQHDNDFINEQLTFSEI